VGTGISDVIAANLERSGLFRVIDKAAYIQKPEALQLQPRFADWRIIDTEALVAGRVATEMDGRLRVEFRLWDALAGRQMTGLAYLTTNENWRRIAHIISDAIYKRLTGEDGYFDTRIVYVSEDGPGNARVKRLAIMDQDGANHRFLTKGDHLVLTPRFSPTGPEITYLAYYNDKPRVYLQNIDTGKIEVLGDFSGMTFAPRFSPDGDKVVMSLEAGGNSDIYTMDLRTRRVEQLTDHLAIDTSPSYAPDGKRIVFESDRGGTQQLYVASSEGGRPERITFGQGRYGNPVWSPRGDLIAFTKMWGGNFFIGVIRPDGTGERLLVQAYHVEGPSWAPNGRVLMYFKESPTGPRGRSRKAKLWSIDITGYNEQEVATPLDASDPAWSPLIQ
ncbi:MAG: Tol-Pal system beta propeller repeat protein TolB, partial [Pseudomonadota bacterium]|nr:Tol-Pal system beta propeller repeat protein TolB [Pseudomonadota bacterium]